MFRKVQEKNSQFEANTTEDVLKNSQEELNMLLQNYKLTPEELEGTFEAIENLHNKRKDENDLSPHKNKLNDIKKAILLTDEIEKILKIKNTQNENNTHHAAESQTQTNNTMPEQKSNDIALIDEKLKHLLTVPLSAKTLVEELLCYIQLKKSNVKSFHIKNQDVEITNKYISNCYTQLKTRLEVEKKLKPHNIAPFIKNADNADSTADFDSLNKNLKMILKELQLINVLLVQKLENENQKSVEALTNRDGVFFLGRTGVGKSTTIQYLSGSTLELDDLGNYRTTKIINKAAENIITSHLKTQSVTSHVTTVPINTHDIGSQKDMDIVLCDTPGYPDTRSAEIEIVNSSKIINALQSTKSVRLVYLIKRENTGARYENIMDELKFLSEALPEASSYQSSFIFCFTGYQNHEIKQIKSTLREKLKNLKESDNYSNQDVIDLLSILVRKLDDTKIADIAIINPSDKSKAKNLIEEVIKLNPIKVRDASDPKSLFHFAVSDNTKNTVDKQCNLYKQDINNALERNELELAMYYFDEFHILLRYFKDDKKIQETYETSLNLFETQIQNRCNQILDLIDNQIMRDNSIIKLDYDKLKSDLKNIDSLETFINKFKSVENKITLKGDLLQNLKTKILVLSNIENINLKAHLEDAVFRLEKLSSLKNLFITGEIAELADKSYLKTCEIVKNFILNLQTEVENAIKSNKFEFLAEQLVFLQKYLPLIANHCQTNDWSTYSQLVQSKLTEHLQNCYFKAIKQIPQGPHHKFDFAEIQASYQILEKAASCSLLQNLFKNEINIQSYADKFIKEISMYFHSVCSKIENQEEVSNHNFFKVTKSDFSNMKQLLEITNVAKNELANYYKIVNTMHSRILKAKEKIIQIIKELRANNQASIARNNEGNGQIDYDDLNQSLKNFKIIESFDEYIPNIYKELSGDLAREISRMLGNIEKSAKKLKFDKDKITQLQTAKFLLESLSDMDALEVSDDETDSVLFKAIAQRNKILENLKQEIYQSFKRAAEPYVLPQNIKINNSNDIIKNNSELKQVFEIDIDDFSKTLTYFKKGLEEVSSLENDTQFKPTINELKGAVLTFATSYGKFMTNSIRENLDALTRKDCDDIKHKVTIITDFYNEIKEIKRIKSTTEFEIFNLIFGSLGAGKDPFMLYKERLPKCYSEFEVRLGSYSSTQIDQIREQLDVLDLLALMDLKELSLKNCDFRELHSTLTAKYVKFRQVDQSSIIQMLDSNQYEEIARLIKIFPEQSLAIAKEIISRHIVSLVRKLITIIKVTSSIVQKNILDESKLETMSTLLTHIQNANSFLKEHFDSTTTTIIDSVLKNCKGKITTLITNKLTDINEFLNMYEFRKALALLNEIDERFSKLEGFYDTEIVENKIKETKDNLPLKGKELAESFTKEQLFSKSPKKTTPSVAYTELEALTKYIRNKKILEDFLTSIATKANSELNELSLIKISDTHTLKELKATETQIEHFPESLKTRIKENINESEKKLKQDITVHKSEIENALKSKDIMKIESLQSTYNSLNASFWLNELFNALVSEFQKACNYINNWVDNDNAINDETLIHLKIVNEYATVLTNTGQNKPEKYDNLVNSTNLKFSNKISQDFNFVVNKLTLVESCNLDIPISTFIGVLEKTFQVTYYFTQKYQLTFDIIKLPTFISNLTTEVNQKFKSLYELIKRNQDKITNKTISDDLQKLLTESKYWEPILIELKKCFKKNEIFLKNNNILSTSHEFEKLQSFDTLFDTVFIILQNKLKNVLLINERTKLNSTRKTEFYMDLNTNINKLETLNGLIPTLKISKVSVSSFKEKVNTHISAQIDSLYKDVMIISDKDGTQIFSINFQEFDLKVSILEATSSYLETYKDIATLYFDKIKSHILHKIDLIIDESKTLFKDIPTFAERLIALKKFTNKFIYKSEIIPKIDVLLKIYRDTPEYGAAAISKLGVHLNAHKADYETAQFLLREHKCFSGYMLTLFNNIIQSHKIKHVIEKLIETDEPNARFEIDTIQLENVYENFDKEYQELVYTNLTPGGAELTNVKNALFKIVNQLNTDLPQKSEAIQWRTRIRETLPTILSHIFAIWTLQNSEYFYDLEQKPTDSKEKIKSQYLRKPHVGQVIAIFRMLGIGYKAKEGMPESFAKIFGKTGSNKVNQSRTKSQFHVDPLFNNLIEIRSGEGKSVVLAVTAAVLALLKMDVSIACYSEYLSHRDSQLFMNLFKILEVEDHIYHSTFNDLCERFINSKFNIRSEINHLISGSLTPEKNIESDQNSRAKILLVDEVDVFFSKEFYGNFYIPSLQIENSLLTELVKYLWDNKHTKLSLNAIKSLNLYKNCVSIFKSSSEFIKSMNHKNVKIEHGYVLYPVLGDGDCAYTAFGIIRDDVMKYLLDEIHVPAIQQLLSPAIVELFVQEDKYNAFIQYLKKENLISTDLLKMIETHKLECKSSTWKPLNEIDNFTSDLNILRGYIYYDVREKKIQNGWGHPAVLQALAEIRKIHLLIWQRDNSAKNAAPKPHPQFAEYLPDNATTRTDILYTGMDHFDRIEFLPEDEDSIDWSPLLDAGIKLMISDLHDYHKIPYIVQNAKIGYKDQDSISFKINYGYKTMFAYFAEHEKNPSVITKTIRDAHIRLMINCGFLSYDKIPGMFDRILGVTGTLKTLPLTIREMIKENYKIETFTYMPSVFGQDEMKFAKNDDTQITNTADYNKTLYGEMQKRLIGNNGKPCRAVIVFFKDYQKLEAYLNSEEMKLMSSEINLLTEELKDSEKEIAIKRATTSGQITFSTKAFGRGIDFVCLNPIVQANKGVHIIQTFLSEELSEEIQIQYRTARQGQDGSYSMILLDQDLKDFGILATDIDDLKNNSNTRYERLNKKRNEMFENKYKDPKKIEDGKQLHQSTLKAMEHLQNKNYFDISKFIMNVNQSNVKESRTICLMDATGSMEDLLENAKNTVETMFERAIKILEDNHINPDRFKLQFAVYRNYNCHEDTLLENSPWESDASKLSDFMRTINANGGRGDEAIEVGLWHVNQEAENGDVTQVILIGDAPPQSKENVKEHRNIYGEKYWSETKFRYPTHYTDQLNEIKKRNIPIHTFFVKKDAKLEAAFQEIAKETKGKSEFLDISSKKGAEHLTDIVTTAILKDVGGEAAGEDLVNQYRETYKSYSN